MKKVLSVFIVALVLCAGLAGCSIEVAETKVEEGPVYYYYNLSENETELVKEVYHPSAESLDVMMKELLQIYGRKNEEGPNSNLLPEEVIINSYILSENVMTFDFNSKYSNMSRSREALVRLGIVKTFLQIPDILGMKFTIAGEELKNSKNESIGKMTADTFVELSDDFDTYRYDTFTLYFTDKNGKKLVKEQRSVYYKRTLQKERVVLEQLAKGPMVKGNYPTISENTGVLDITIADQVCYVDLSSSFVDYALEILPETALYSVVNSLMDASDVQKVQISIEGKSSYELSEKLPLYSFYEKNEDLVKKGE